ncbi:MAG: chromate efflux transporter [Pirellulales bacterium]
MNRFPAVLASGRPMLARLSELATLFLKLGIIGFGGPAVHISTMEDEVVHRRGWIDRQHFLDLVGATNLIPGPNSTEMAIHVGFLRAGLAGLLVAGVCFVVPAVLITLGFAWVYEQYGQSPNVAPLLEGIKPAVLAVILAAGWRLAKVAIRSVPLAVIAMAVAAAAHLGVEVAVALLVGGLLGMLYLRLTSGRNGRNGVAANLLTLAGALMSRSAVAGGVLYAPVVLAADVAHRAGEPSLWRLGLFFLKVGAVLYGSGYVLVAYLRDGIEAGGALAGVLSEDQLLEAIAIGQFTPGPILSTATFIGYLVAGVPGAVVATLGIFLPSFVFVAITNPLIPRLRQSAWMSAFLDAVNAAAIGLLALVTVTLARGSLVDVQSWLIALAAAVVLLVWKVQPAWLILGGAVAGAVGGRL